MNDDKKLIGQRLKRIRQVFQSFFNKTAAEFAEQFAETEFNIRNYEAGKAGVPARLLSILSKYGFSAHFILTGEGGIYSNTNTGLKLEEKIEGKKPAKTKIEMITEIDHNKLSIEELLSQAEKFNAAAGDIMRLVQEKSKIR